MVAITLLVLGSIRITVEASTICTHTAVSVTAIEYRVLFDGSEMLAPTAPADCGVAVGGASVTAGEGLTPRTVLVEPHAANRIALARSAIHPKTRLLIIVVLSERLAGEQCSWGGLRTPFGSSLPGAGPSYQDNL